MEKSTILKNLRSFIESKERDKLDKRTARFYDSLNGVDESRITIGKEPKYFTACLECNSTGVGVSSFEGTETQRTVSLDYITNEILFIDGHTKAAENGICIFYLKPNQKIDLEYYKKSDIEKAAKNYGYQLHKQNFNDLNFFMREHRLNRYKVHIKKGPFSYPIRPVFATLDGDKTVTVGYVYEKDGKEYVLIEPQLPKSKAELLGCATTALFGILLLPVALCFSLFKGISGRKKQED